MSNKIQANCIKSNRFTVWFIKHLEIILKIQYSDLKDIDQKIKENDEAFDYHQNFPNNFESIPKTFFENNKVALVKRRSIILLSYQGHCKEVRKYKSKLCIC